MNRGRERDHFAQLNSDVNEVTTLLRNNVEKVIERGEKIDDLQERSGELEAGSIQFRKTAHEIKKKMCWQNCKLMCIIGLVIFIIITIIIVIVLVELKPWENSSGKHHNKTLDFNPQEFHFKPD